MVSGRWMMVAAAIVVLLGLVNLSFVHDRLHYASDSRAYIGGATSLLAGDGYLAPESDEPQRIWPPGYAVSLMPLLALWDDAIWPMKVANVIFATLALWLFWLAFRRLEEVPGRLGIVVLAGISFPWVYYTQFVGSEALFALGVAGLLVAFGRLAANGAVSRRWWWLAVVLAGLLPLVRLVGVASLPALAYVAWIDGGRGLRLVRERQWKRIAMLAGGCLLAGLPLLWWMGRNMALAGEVSGYSLTSDEFRLNALKVGVTGSGLWSRTMVNVLGYAHVFLVPDLGMVERIAKLPLVVRLACWGQLALMLVGWGVSWRWRRWRPLAVLASCYAAMLMTVGWYDMRYVMPFLPVYFLYLATGGWLVLAAMSAIWRRAAAPRLGWMNVRLCMWGIIGLAIVGSSALTLAGGQAKRLRSRQYEGKAQGLYQAAQWIRAAEGEGAVLTWSPGFLDLWTGRPVLSLNVLTRVHGDAWPEAVGEEARFLLVASGLVDYKAEYVAPFLAARGEEWRLAYDEAEVRVYERVGR